MLDRFLEALTGRRLGGALLVLAGVIVGLAFLTTKGDDDKPEPKKTQPALIVSVPQLGLTFAHPRAWKRSIDGRVITLRSPERTSVLTFSSPAPGRAKAHVLEALERALRGRYKNAQVVRRGPGKLGLHPVSTFELLGSSAGKQVRALGLVGDTDYRTYAVTLLTPRRPSAKRLVEAQQIFATVRFAVPSKRKR